MINLIRKTGRLFLNYLFPSFQNAFFIGALLAVSMQGHVLLNADGDIGRHITIGNYIAKNWNIPTRDIFSHTMYGEHLVPHEWLAEWIFSRFHAWMDLDGVVAITSILIATSFTIVYHQIRKRNSYTIVALLTTGLAAFASSLHWIARPHVFTFLFVAIWTYLLADRYSKAWYFPVIMLVWANTHGAFIAGFAIWLAYMAGWLWDYLQKQSDRTGDTRLAMIGLSSFAVTFINPSGWHLWSTSAGYYGNQFLVNSTIEYLSPNIHNWSTWPFCLCSPFACWESDSRPGSKHTRRFFSPAGQCSVFIAHATSHGGSFIKMIQPPSSKSQMNENCARIDHKGWQHE